MTFLDELQAAVAPIAARVSLDVDGAELLTAVRALGGDVVDVVAEAAAAKNVLERLLAIGAGVIAETSPRGHGGVAAVRGHRSPVALVQDIAGGTRADAVRAVRVGAALLEAAAPGATEPAGAGEDADGDIGADRPGDAAVHEPEACVRWDAALGDAVLSGALTTAQHDAIRRGLGMPPQQQGHDPAEVERVWAIAAEQLLREAEGITAEETARRARATRDALDPRGAQDRFDRRYQARAFRMWSDDDGGHHARIDFDDEMAAWVRSVIGAALRPRRGGPRFIAADERDAADELARDPRTNDQLAYDLMMDVLRAGALADARDVFGARQPGVRVVTVHDPAGATAPRDAFGRLAAVGHLEDHGEAIAGGPLERIICDTGVVRVRTDPGGNPLDVGREQRLYTSKQRVALAVRDGGCRWPGCDRPPSSCEAHHCDHWSEHGGATDCRVGILLCRFHHMLLHNNGWRITRHGTEEFLLHPPPGAAGGGAPVPMPSRSPLRWAWEAPPHRGGWRSLAPASLSL